MTRIDSFRTTETREQGFSLIELMVAGAIFAILAALGGLALNGYAKRAALSGAQQELATQLRELQQAVGSESHPVVYGARLRAGSGEIGVTRFDPRIGTSGTCSLLRSVDLEGRTEIASITDFVDRDPAAICRTQITSTQASDRFVWFFARGTSVDGSVTLSRPGVGITRSVSVAGLTGRVDEL
ncbi:MAG: type II secretion system protein [Actinomycetota bacterium]